MNRQEFIDRLRAALNGKIPPALVEDNVSYYQDYINVEMRKGRTEKEVLDSLGDPRLIARTIVQTSGQESGGDEPERSTNYEEVRSRYGSGHRSIRIPGWLMTIIVILVVVLGFSLLFSVLSFLAPLIMVLIAVIFMIKLFRDWLN